MPFAPPPPRNLASERLLRALFVLLWAAAMEAIGLGVVLDALRWARLH